MMASILAQLKRPAVFLTVVNVLCACIGFLKGVFVVRRLGAEWLGVIAIIVGIVDMVANFVDPRLSDITAKLFYAVPTGKSRAAQQREIVQGGVVLQCGLAIILFLVAIVITVLFAGFFTDKKLQMLWIIGIAANQAIMYVAGLLTFIQRLTERFYYLGTLQLLTSAVSTFLLCGTLYLNTSLGGYADGLLISALGTMAITLLGTFALWRSSQGHGLITAIGQCNCAGYFSNLRFIFWTNILGYSKLLHRAVDVLVVGWFFNDRDTGLYKFARQMTDTLYVVYDAMNKVYQPKFLSLLADGQRSAFIAKARILVSASAAVTAAMVIAELATLPWILKTLFPAEFASASTSIILLTAPFFFVVGLSIWIWPLLVHYGRIGQYSRNNVVAVLIGQYGIALAFCLISGRPHIEWFAVGYFCNYLILYCLTYKQLARDYSDYLPFGRNVRKAIQA